MMKRALAVILVMIALAPVSGCRLCNDEVEVKPNVTVTSSQFNEESYIWEQLFFPTNRTSGVQ